MRKPKKSGMFGDLKVKTVTLEYGTQIYAAASYDNRFENNRLKVQEIVSQMDYTMHRRMLALILNHQNPKRIVYRTPANWWEFLKRDHAPEWFKKRWPVRENVESVEIKDCYPFPEEKMPDKFGPCIRIALAPDVRFWKPPEEDDL